MMEREDAIREFLQRAGWRDSHREVLKGDASTRRYERLHGLTATAILMDQPPGKEGPPCPPDATPEEREKLGSNALERKAAGRVDAFIACASYLRSRRLSAPEIIAADPALGLALLEDLGDDLYAPLIRSGVPEGPLYDTAIDALSVLHAETPPKLLEGPGVTWPLLEYDTLALSAAGGLLVEWLPKFNTRLDIGETAKEEWHGIWKPILARGAEGATVFCHRDYHAENLIWLPTRSSFARVGLLDFQDALRAHPVWDLSMLLHDARRDVSLERETAALNRYFDQHPKLDREAFLADYNALGLLNIARILGIFSRLVVRDAKPRYADFMPRLWRYLDRCLANPNLGDLKQWFDRHVPAEHRRLPATLAR